MPSPNDKTYLKNINVTSSRAVQRSMGAVTSLPARFDLRTSSRVTAVKNQGSYGTCWAHGTMASIESGLLTSKAEAFDLSEKQLALNHDWDMGYKGFTAGGNGDIAASFLTQWKGPILESQDPYPDNSYYSQWYPDYTNGNVYALNSILPASPNVMPIGHVQHIRWIPAMSTNMTAASIKSELVPIKLALMEFGALYVDYFHCQYFYGDFDGKYQTIQQDGKNYYYGSSWMDTYFFDDDREIYEYFELGGGHAVTIVGWDDNFSRDNFRYTPPGDGAFIVKNSWGEDFGIDGYFYVSYYDRYFAKGELMSFAGIEAVDNYSAIYQYDPMGYVRPYHPNSNGGETAWGANVFVATNNAPLAAVGFYALSPNTSYQIVIYTSCSADDPTSGNQKLKQTGVTDYAGFVTVPLTDTVALTRGTRFSVVLKLTTPGKNEPLALEGLYYYETRTASANIGESFVSEDGKAWGDLASIRMDYGTGSYNFCCKAYTKSATAPKPTLASIVISGVASLTSGQSAQFSCEAIYTDQSKKDISPTWSITRAGQAYATVSASGLVTAKEVSAQQTVTVQATYTEDGITKDATWGMFVTIAAPNTPTDVTASQGTETSCVRVNWIAPNGATEYAVYRATANNSRNAQYLDKVTVPKYNDTSAVPGVDYWYFVKAKNSSGASGFSDGANGWRKLAPPESVTASDTLLDKVALEWSEVEGATHYRVYRAESMDGEKTALGNWQSATTFNDTTATAGVTYFYFVVAAVDASGNRPSDYSLFDDGIRPEPITIDHLEIKGDASIAAGGFADYAADAIYTDGHKVENIAPNNWEIVGDGASIVGCRMTAATVTENKSVVLKATYTEGGKTVTGEKSITIAAVKPVAPRNVAAVAAAQGVTLSWNAVAGAASYAIYRDGNAVGRVVPNAPGDVPATTYTDFSAIPGVTYSYMVSASNGAGEGPQSSPAVTATIPLPAPTGVTATTDRTDGVFVDWRRVMDNAPYQGQSAVYFRVARATSADGAKTELVSWTADTSFLDTSAPVDTPLWYFVRAATDSSGANASGWSAGVVGRVVPNAPQLLAISISGPDRVAASGSAVYSCTAKYSDGTSKSVSPVWSASGAAAIDANGKLTAHAVTADADVAVTAAFGGKSATKDVKVLAPVQASASVSNVRVKPRWPFSTLVDIDYTLSTAPEGTRALVTLSGQDNDHDVPLAAKTLTGDAVGAAVAAGEHRLTWDIGADYPGFHAASFDVKIEAIPYTIAAPANIRHSTTSTCEESLSGAGVVTVVWHVRHSLAWDAAEGAVSYKVFRNTANNFSTATLLSTVTGTSYGFDGTGKEPAYYYWVVAVKGASSAASDVFAVAATTVDLMPLRNLLTTIESISPDGVLADNEINSAISNPRFSDMDGDPTTNSPEELYVFTRIKALNTDKQLISDVMRGDYTNIGGSTLLELFELSECCRGMWGGNYSSVVLFPKRPSNVSATQQNYGTAKVVVSWAGIADAQGYEVWRSATKDFSSGVTKVADVTTTSYTDTNVSYRSPYSYMILAKYADGSRLFSPIYVYGYWGDWCLAEVYRDLMPLRNVLNVMDGVTGDVDGYVSDTEMDVCMVDPHARDLDGNSSVISSAEKAVFTRIQTLNNDKELIHRVIQGDYTYRGMTLAQMKELQSISDAIKELTKNRNN